MHGDTNDPFSDLEIVDTSFLEACSARTKCIKCNKSRKYYCYSCCIALPQIQDQLPKVKLPLKVDIIKHPGELDGKSTAPHASILASDDVTIYTFPCIPDYEPEKVLILFPGEDSVEMEELKAQIINKKELVNTNNDALQKDISTRNEGDKERDNVPNNGVCITKNTEEISPSDSHTVSKRKRTLSDENNEKIGTVDHDLCEDSMVNNIKHQKTHLRQCPFEKVVFVDCTWNQTKQIVNDERLKGLKRVELKSQSTHFWRSQDGMPKTYLSTIEAIYYFFKDFHSIFVDPIYRHEYDNLLMFFSFMYHKIKKSEKGSV